MKLSEEAIELIEQAAITTPLECLEKIKVSLRKLNKFIKIVSKSSASSKTIQQYKTDGLAKDSEDNRRIRGAEKKVIEKLKTVVNNPIIRRNPTEFSTMGPLGVQHGIKSMLGPLGVQHGIRQILKHTHVSDWEIWEISGTLFNYLNSTWGSFTTDCFESIENIKVCRFNLNFTVLVQ